jgi:hypothetical protein
MPLVSRLPESPNPDFAIDILCAKMFVSRQYALEARKRISVANVGLYDQTCNSDIQD